MFEDRLILEYIDGRKWRLVEELTYFSPSLKRTITVPAEFITDFASVPRAFWRVFPPTGKYGKAAVIHDYLYAFNGCTRAEADGVFLEAMEMLGVSWFTRRSMWLAVRAGGWKPWNAYRKAQEK